MEGWKIVFQFKWVIRTFHVNLPGCIQIYLPYTVHRLQQTPPVAKRGGISIWAEMQLEEKDKKRCSNGKPMKTDQRIKENVVGKLFSSYNQISSVKKTNLGGISIYN